MTIFARRRIQAMLDELAPCLRSKKARDLIQRLNNRKQVDQALPAEMELALLWALLRLGELDVEPDWWGDERRPDAITDRFVPGRSCAIEIAAVSDNRISGEETMDAIAYQISSVVSRVIKGAGDQLYFTFQEESFYERGRYVRRRLAPAGFKLAEGHNEAIHQWLNSSRYLHEPLRLVNDGLDVTIEYTDYKQTRFHNIFSTMPAEAHSLEDNPLFELLVRKAKQLRGAATGTLRIIFLADVGSTLLRHLGRIGDIDHTRRRVSAGEIITHFLENRSTTVDAVVTFSPFKDISPFSRIAFLERSKPRRWNVGFFGTPALPSAPATLATMTGMLPDPHYEGYQARSLFRQGAFSHDNSGQYLGMSITSAAGQDGQTVTFPARLLLDLLAGRITPERFRYYVDGTDGKRNVFKHWLDMGMTISGAEMAQRSLDEDDDHLILHFSDDPAARPFKLPDDPPGPVE